MTAEIEAAVTAAGLQPLSSQVASSFQSYLELLLKWNARLNLTAIRDPEEILHRHFIECIFAAQQLPENIHTLLDFGSGGGFPGIPIALCRPEIQVTLGESQAKKATFLRESLRTLGVSNATVHNGRIEDLEQTFDAVALRAVDKMLEACRIAVRNIGSGGYFALFITENTSHALTAEFHQFSWQEPLRLPASSQRLLMLGQLIDVPRGTKQILA